MKHQSICPLLVMLLLCFSALGQAVEPPITGLTTRHGSAYIQCAQGPFHLKLDTLEALSSAVMDTSNSLFGIRSASEPRILDIVVDSVDADIVIEGAFGVFLVGNDIEVDSKTDEDFEYPVLSSASFVLEGKTYDFRLENAYQGGCRHDRLIWTIKE